jgi:hypothetical protein
MSFLAEILVHTSFFGAFLTGFYFLFVKYIQSQSLISDLFNNYEQYITNSAIWSDPSKVQDVLGQLDGVVSNIESSSDFNEANASITAKNDYILSRVTISVGIICPFLFITGILIEYYSGGSVYDLLISNIIVIVFIAASEFFLVGIFLRNFIEIDSDFINAIPVASHSDRYLCTFVDDFKQQVLPPFISKFFT